MKRLQGLPHDSDAPPSPLAGIQAAQSPKPQGILSASYDWCEVLQVVDLTAELEARGLTREDAHTFLDLSPSISFNVWYGNLDNCEDGHVSFEVHLDRHDWVLPSYRGTAPNFWGRSALATSVSVNLLTDRMAWRRWSADFSGYGSGLRRALLVLRGRHGMPADGQNRYDINTDACIASPELRFSFGKQQI